MPTMASRAGAPSHCLLNKGMDREEVRAGSSPKQAAPPSWDSPLSPVLIYQPEHPTASPCSKDAVSHAGIEPQGYYFLAPLTLYMPQTQGIPSSCALVVVIQALPGSEFLGHIPSLTTLWAILRQGSRLHQPPCSTWLL